MRIPQTPPLRFDDLFSEGPPEADVLAALQRVPKELQDGEYEGKYIHWDELRRKRLPEGVTAKDVWTAIKFRRFFGVRRPIPLRDVRGNVFSYALPDPATERLHKVDQGAAGLIATSEPTGNATATRDRYIISSLMEEAIRSSQLEGAATTRRIAKEMLMSERKPRDTSERMILNNFLALGRIRKLHKQPLTPELLLELHRILTIDTLDDPGCVGRFRAADDLVRVEDMEGTILHVPPPAEELPARLESLCAFANESSPGTFIHPVIRSILLHFWLAYDHPFVDGNGRCARALFYWSMLRSEYWLTEFISISRPVYKNRSKYARAFLHTETDDNDLTYFVLYHLDVIARALAQLHEYIAKKGEEQRRADKLLRSNPELNHRQRELLQAAIREPTQLFTIKAHMNTHAVSYGTARTDLQQLENRGFLVSFKEGRTWLYSPVKGLSEMVGV